MLYYRVKPEFNGKRRWKENSRGEVVCDGEYIAHELYTVKELSYHRLSLIAWEKMFEPVHISKKKTYWSFGCRFALDDAEELVQWKDEEYNEYEEY